MSSRTVALLGGTGHIGQEVAKVLVDPKFRSSYQEVVSLVRKSSSVLDDIAEGNAPIRLFTNDDLSGALEGVDVLISKIGPAGHDFKDFLIDVVAKSTI